MHIAPHPSLSIGLCILHKQHLFGSHCRERLHYEMYELEKFEHIECESPLFFCFLLIDGVYNQDVEQVNRYNNLLQQRLIHTEDNIFLLPELFYVPKVSSYSDSTDILFLYLLQVTSPWITRIFHSLFS